MAGFWRRIEVVQRLKVTDPLGCRPSTGDIQSCTQARVYRVCDGRLCVRKWARQGLDHPPKSLRVT